MPENKTLKPQMKFKAFMSGNEPLIKAACPHSSAWFESMGRHTIKPEELHYVGKMGIELSFVEGRIYEAQKKIGKENLSNDGILRGTFDAMKDLKK